MEFQGNRQDEQGKFPIKSIQIWIRQAARSLRQYALLAPHVFDIASFMKNLLKNETHVTNEKDS